ncbi:MAG: hypothetical protein ACOX7L_08190 [Dethiobacteria bacterium]|jgi:hypothetical protein
MKKTKYIALILVLAFGLIGGAYAAWGDTLYAHGTVATGDVDVIFTKAKSNDPPAVGGEEMPDPGQPEGKDVASTEVVKSEDGKSLFVTIENAYPGYVSEIDFTVKNNGSIPVKLVDKTCQIKSGDPAGLVVENCCIRCWLIDNGYHGWLLKFLRCRCGGGNENPGDESLKIGDQIHPGEECNGTIGHYVTKDAKQNKDYKYKITYDFVQWNLYDGAVGEE